MRLSSHTVSVIRDTASHLFGDEASVYLFGSRLDDSATGGDVDLLLELPAGEKQPVRAALKLNAKLQMALGEQRIDVITTMDHPDVVAEALRTGVKL